MSQDKYAIDILYIFRMESCKPKEAYLETKLSKQNATSGEEVDATIYQHLMGSLMYLMNTCLCMCYEFN